MRRRRRVAGKLQNVCPHIHALRDATHEGGRFLIRVEWQFETFFGTEFYFCQGCGSKWSQFSVNRYSEDLQVAAQHDMAGTVERLMRNKRKAIKLANKLRRLGGLLD